MKRLILRASRSTFGLVLVGSLLVQVAWILAVAPYRSTDEFDHAYRADYVAHGHWETPTTAAPDGRGALVSVRPEIVESAEAVCASYSYTGPDNCRAVAFDEGLAQVATGAFAYHPAYYWVVGTPSLLVEDGEVTLLVMRLAGALLCAFGIAFAAQILRGSFRSAWPGVALLIGVTPVFTFSTSMVGPNGLEMVCGLVCWAGFTVMGVRGTEASHQRLLLLATGVAAICLTSLRQLGPLWLFLIAGTCLLAFGWRGWVALARAHPILLPAIVASVALATGLALQSIVTSGLAGAVGAPSEDVGSPWLIALSQVPIWPFQSIAAFPIRNDPAPTIVYAIYLAAACTLLVGGLVRARGRLRLALVATVLLSFAVPVLVTATTIDLLFATWQGRYGLPFSVGGMLIAGVSLDRLASRTGGFRFSRWWPVAAALAVGQTVSILGVVIVDLGNEAARQSAIWPIVPLGVLAALALVGVGCVALPFLEQSDQRPARPDRASSYDGHRTSARTSGGG